MTTVRTPTTIRSLFATRRPIDRPIEKVIDYYATDAKRLLTEIEEYEVTANVEANLDHFLRNFSDGVRTGKVTEIGFWVSGFYGSGKSSFTKYLGFALDPDRKVGDRPFIELLAERISSLVLRQDLKTLAATQPTTVIMLDLGAEQLASSSVAAVSAVLYWKVLQWAGYSKEEKLARLELRLEREGRLEDFHQAYSEKFGGTWESVHNDPLVGVARADQIVTQFYPQDYPSPGTFRSDRFSLAIDARQQASEIIDLIRRKTGRKNILFLIDEAGQYVAPRSELILNLDGLARNFKELGQGRVWIAATGQQTLAEIVEKAAYNSTELNKLRDRFPISLELDARDIKEITWKRLLSKSAEGEAALSALFRQHGQAMTANTRMEGTSLFKGDPEEDVFVRLYPFLPQHFDLLMELIRTLARSTGGIGLRSAIRVIQDLLVDASHVLPAGAQVLADMPVGQIATADMFFDTLHADIDKSMPHVVAGVDRVAQALPGDVLALRVAKAVGALQPMETFPRTAENIAALLYQQVGDLPLVDAVRGALHRLLDVKEVGLVDDPQTGGYTFLSEGVKPLRDKRNSYQPTSGELSLLRSRLIQTLFESLPSATIEGAKTVKAGIRLGRVPLVGDDEDVQIRLETTDGAGWNGRRTALLTETTGHPEWRTSIAWLIQPSAEIDDLLPEIVRSQKLIQDTSEAQADRAIAQFIRSERTAAEANQERVRTLYRQALMQGILIFRGAATPASVAGSTIDLAARHVLGEAAVAIYPSFHLVNIRPGTELAAKFLGVERLDRMPKELDPLGFVRTVAGKAHVNAQHPALAEALRVFREKLDSAGTTRLQGNTIQDVFASAPYGWSKDATRYVFAGLLASGEIVLHTGAGPVKTAGPAAIEAMKNTQAFGKVGVSIQDVRIPIEMLDRAATRLQEMLGSEVLPLENHISRAAREQLPSHLDEIAPLPDRLRLLGLAGVDRAQSVIELGKAMLKEDGAAAIPLLGTVVCSFPEDLKWAKRTQTALDNDAGSDVVAARDLLREADELNVLFPGALQIKERERATIDDALASDIFFTLQADLLGIERSIRDRAREVYHARWGAYQEALARARETLEALPEWLQLDDDDRREIAAGLIAGSLDGLRDGSAAALPEQARERREIAQLRLLLVRRTGIPGLLEQLTAEVTRRLPAPPPLPVEALPGESLIDLDISSVMPAAVIRTDDELDAWLNVLRAAVLNARATGAPVRIRVKR